MKTILSLIIVISAIFISLIIISGNTTLAQQSNQISNIQFPIAQLGNCTDTASCKTYCNSPDHQDACLEFAQTHNLMTPQEIKAARVVLTQKGPGGCTSKDSCETYCDNTDHINECISFAEQNSLLSPQELAEAKKVQSAIAKGIKPPACGGKNKCDAYCNEPEHMEECITFSQQAGLMNDQESADAQKVLAAIKSGVKPPPCHGKEECDAYCAQDNHADECIKFAEAAGFMTPQDAEMAKKTGGKGPGGCRGKEECDAFCQTNSEVCFQFGVEHGLVSQEDLQKMKEGAQQMQAMFDKAPPELLNCLTSKLGADKIQAIKNGQMFSNQDGEIIRSCNDEYAKNHPEFYGPQNNGQPQGTEMHRMNFGDFIKTVPPEVKGCISSNLDPHIFDENKDNHEVIDKVMQQCFDQLHQQNPQNNQTSPSQNSGMAPQNMQQMQTPQGQQMPQGQEGQAPMMLNQGQELMPLNQQTGPTPDNQSSPLPMKPMEQMQPISSTSPSSMISSSPLLGFVLEIIKFVIGR